MENLQIGGFLIKGCHPFQFGVFATVEKWRKNINANGALQTSLKMDEYLVADLSRDTRKLRVVGKGREVFDSLKEWGRSNAAPVPVLIRKISI